MCGQPMHDSLRAPRQLVSGKMLMGSWLLLAAALLACDGTIFPVDSENRDGPAVSPQQKYTLTVDYEISLVGSGETVQKGCVAVDARNESWELAAVIQAAIPLEVEYQVELTRQIASVARDPELLHSHYCGSRDRYYVYAATPPACVSSDDDTRNTLTATAVLDAHRVSLQAEPGESYVWSDGQLTQRYQLLSHMTGRVVLDLSTGPCEEGSSGYPHRTFALLTVLEESP